MEHVICITHLVTPKIGTTGNRHWLHIRVVVNMITSTMAYFWRIKLKCIKLIRCWWQMKCDGLVWFIVFNATFKNISVISWWSVLLVEQTGVLKENNRPVASRWQTLMLYRVYLVMNGVQAHDFRGDRHWLYMLDVMACFGRIKLKCIKYIIGWQLTKCNGNTSQG